MSDGQTSNLAEIATIRKLANEDVLKAIQYIADRPNLRKQLLPVFDVMIQQLGIKNIEYGKTGDSGVGFKITVNDSNMVKDKLLTLLSGIKGKISLSGSIKLRVKDENNITILINLKKGKRDEFLKMVKVFMNMVGGE